jgi:protein-L-isoaspartate(D-aspartate) O-methyltransferase
MRRHQREARPRAVGETADDTVGRTLATTPREGFLPGALRERAHDDTPLPIGHDQTSSQPSTVAAMLRLLDVPVGTRVLDVGAGSGWTTVLLARLVGPGGEVLGLELVPELAAWGASNVAAANVSWARLEAADPSRLGRDRPGGWDRILVSAAARRLPDALVEQLAPGGRMVVPVQNTMELVERDRLGRVHVTEHGSYVFVPLLGPFT